MQVCSISTAVAMEILQSCTKPWIWYQCIHLRSCLSAFIPKYFLQNIKKSLVAKRTIHGRTLGRPLDSWVAFGDRATIFQQHWKWAFLSWNTKRCSETSPIYGGHSLYIGNHSEALLNNSFLTFVATLRDPDCESAECEKLLCWNCVWKHPG